MLNDDPQVSSSIHPHASVLGDDGGSSTVGSLLGGPNDTHSNVSSTTTDHQASQFLGHLDGVSGTPSSSTNPHDDIFFTGNSSRPTLNTGSNTLQGQKLTFSHPCVHQFFSVDVTMYKNSNFVFGLAVTV